MAGGTRPAIVDIMETLTRTPVRRGGLRWGDCIYCGHKLHKINGGVCNVIVSDTAGEVVLCTCERGNNGGQAASGSGNSDR